MKILSSSTDKKIDLSSKKEISIYVCGPTVYNHIHIGNIRPILTFDVMHRFLRWKGIKVNFVHNITDIDDKILKTAKSENIPELEFSNFYTKAYLDILNKMNILTDINMPKVSDNMDDIVNFIEELVKKEKAYILDDGVYFDTSKATNYGIVSNMNIDKLEAGKRINTKDNKKNANDFVLWKIKTDGITWNSPFGKGRPGWHTECVVLINKYIKDTVDIHGGGIDLRFPHHENENAQFESLYTKPLANIWMHVGHLMMNNEKMSKSVGNFIIVKDILEEWEPNALRWFFYQVNYQKPINFTFEYLSNANKDIEKIFYELNKAKSFLIINNSFDEKLTANEEVIGYFEDNLNFPNIITVIQENTKMFANLIKNKSWDQLNKVRNEVLWILNILGIKYEDVFNKDIISKLNLWNQLISDKDFEKADELRKLFISKKIM